MKKILSILVLVLTLSFSTEVLASLTFTTDAITGTTASSIDLGTGNTLSLQTTSNAPVTLGTGLVTLGGNLRAGQVYLDGTVPSNGGQYPLEIVTTFPIHTGSVSAASITANSSIDDTTTKAILKLVGNYDGASAGSTATSYGLYTTLFGDSKTPISTFALPDPAAIGIFSSSVDSGGYGGDTIGIFGKGNTGASRNIGVMAYGRSGVLGIGGAFYASNGTNNIGVVATLSSTIPTATSAAILADNGAIAAPIFLARDNGTTKFTIKDGGTVNVTVATYADNAAALTGGLVAGDVYRTATGVLMVVY